MENELSFNFKDYLSQIQANNNESDPNENNEENEFLVDILSGMNFTPPYQNYIENTININFIEDKFKPFRIRKYLYDKLIGEYIKMTENSLKVKKNNDLECLYQKLNKIIYFMLI